MKKEYIKYCLKEFFKNKKKILNNENYLETALFIEDVFGIILDEDEICLENLKTYDNVLKLIYQKVKFN